MTCGSTRRGLGGRATTEPAAVVTHPDRDGTGAVIDGDYQAWTPNELTAIPPDVGMVKVQWADSVDPAQLYWEYSAELCTEGRTRSGDRALRWPHR